MKKIFLVIVALFILFLGVSKIINKEVLPRNFIEEVENNGIDLSEVDAVYVTFPLEEGTYDEFHLGNAFWYDKKIAQNFFDLLNSSEFEHNKEVNDRIRNLFLRFYGRNGAELLFTLWIDKNSITFNFSDTYFATRAVNTEQIFVEFANLIEKFYEEKNLPPKKMKITPLTTEWMSKYK